MTNTDRHIENHYGGNVYGSPNHIEPDTSCPCSGHKEPCGACTFCEQAVGHEETSIFVKKAGKK